MNRAIMNKKSIAVFILFTFMLSTYGQKQSNDKNRLSKFEKKVEAYIIEQFGCKYHHSIEFNKKKKFNLEQLIADHKIPVILKNEPRALKDNEEAFDWLEEIDREIIIAYSMTYIFGMKDEELDAWDPLWVLLLLNDDSEIIGHIRYFP